MLKSYFKIAWRNLKKDRQFTFLNMLGLSTGLTCALLICLWINNELSIGRFNEKDDQLFQVLQNWSTAEGIQTGENTPGLLAKTLKDEIPEIEYAVSTIHPGGLTSEKGIISIRDERFEAISLFAGQDIFNVFSYTLLKGDKDHVLSKPNAIVISDEMAAKMFRKNESAIGKFVDWNQSGSSGLYVITGIFKKPPLTSLDQFDIIFNYDLFLEKNPKLNSWGNSDPFTYIIIKKGTNIDRFNSKISGFIKSKRKESTSTLFAQKYSDRYLYNHYENGVVTGGRIEYVRLFTIVAIFILLIACINFMNLSTSRAITRLKEVGIKKVIGAGRSTLIFQYIGESMILAFLSLLVALLLVIILLPQFNLISGKQISFQFDPYIILSVIGITFLTGLISGSYPAFYLSGFKPAAVLKGTVNNATGSVWLRKGLVIFQFALSGIFIVSVFVVHQQMQLIQTKNLGYNRNNILYFEKGGFVSDNKEDYKPGGKYEQEFERLLLDVKNTPGVLSVANFRHNITNRHGGTTAVSWPGKVAGNDINFTDIAAGYGFIETLGIEMKEGRSFSRGFGNEKASIILNELAVETMGLTNPVGKIIKVWGEDKEIIGVTKNFHFESLYENLKPCFFDFSFNNRASKIMVKIKAGWEKETISKLESLYSSYNPGLPFEYKFLDDDYQELYASEKRVSALSGYFAALAIIISSLGLFGLVAFTAQKRQKEIGIRKVIGASVINVVLMLVKDFLKPVFVAIVLAFPIAYFITQQWLNGFAYRINISATIFIVTSIAIFLITALTISFQAIKAAVANPVKSLRGE